MTRLDESADLARFGCRQFYLGYGAGGAAGFQNRYRKLSCQIRMNPR
jgi:hypothetical protein